MRVFFLITALCACLCAPVAAEPDNLWSRGLKVVPVAGQPANLRITSVSTMASGNVVVVGTFRGTVDLGGIALTSPAVHNLFLATFDPAGAPVWTRVFPGTGVSPSLVRAVAVDARDNVVMVGELSGTTDFGGGPLTASAPRVFIAKFDAQGNHVWSARYGSGLGCMAEDVAIDASGNIVLTGAFLGSINLNGNTLTASESYDGFVAKMSPDGRNAWTKQIGAEGAQWGKHIAVDASGMVAVAGTLLGGITFGDGQMATDGDDVFIANYDGDGHIAWKSVMPASGPHALTSITFDLEGNLIAAGEFASSVDFGERVLTATPGGVDGYVAAIAPGGTTQWVMQAGGPQSESISSVAVGLDGELLVAGSFAESIRLGNELITSGGMADAFVAAIDIGVATWMQGFGGAGWCDVTGLATDVGGNLLLTGSFSEAIELGATQLTGAGFYLAKLGGERPPDLEFAVTLFPRADAIEVRWTFGGVHAFDEVTVFRAGDSEATPSEVFNGPAAAGRFVDRAVVAGEKYRYQVVGVSSTGRKFRTTFATATVPVFTTRLEQNTPNPFNPTTSITYALNALADVALTIFDVSGALVRRIDQGAREAGEYTIDWDGRDDAGNPVGSGVYFYRLEGVAGVSPRKMVLLK